MALRAKADPRSGNALEEPVAVFAFRTRCRLRDGRNTVEEKVEVEDCEAGSGRGVEMIIIFVRYSKYQSPSP